MRVQRALLLVLGVTIALPPATAASPKSDLGGALARDMRAAGSESGAIVRDETADERLFAWNQGTPRVLASNTKLFTLGATLAKRGPRGTIATRAMAAHPLKPDGVDVGVIVGLSRREGHHLPTRRWLPAHNHVIGS